jgi:hypothetical protein
MAGNPIQQMIPQVLQMVMQNPQMLQQIMQPGMLMKLAMALPGITAQDIHMGQALPRVGGYPQSGNPVSVGRDYPLASGRTDEAVERSMLRTEEDARKMMRVPPMQAPIGFPTPEQIRQQQDNPLPPEFEYLLSPDYEEPIA